MKSFAYALRGIAYVVKTQRNMRVHICFAIYVLLAAFVTGAAAGEWAVLLLCIGGVMGMECLNTALEEMCDTVCPERSRGIKHAKDAAAGGVLCAALVSAAAGGVIFFNVAKITAALNFFTKQPVLTAIIVLSLVPGVLFVRGGKKEKQ